MNFNDTLNNKRKFSIVFDSKNITNVLQLNAINKLKNLYPEYNETPDLLINFSKTLKTLLSQINKEPTEDDKIRSDAVQLEIKQCVEFINQYLKDNKKKKISFYNFLCNIEKKINSTQELDIKSNNDKKKKTKIVEFDIKKNDDEDYDEDEVDNDIDNDIDDEVDDDEVDDDEVDDDEDDDEVDDDDDEVDDDYIPINKRPLNKSKLYTDQNRDFINEIMKTSSTDTNTILIKYFNSLTNKSKDTNLKMLKEINNYYSNDKPLLFKIIMLDIPHSQKNYILKKYLTLISPRGESTKLKNWVDSVMSIPFGIYKGTKSNSYTPSQVKTFLDNIQKTMDSAVLGHDEAKRQIVQIMGQKFRNSKSKGNIIGIYGPPGNGKCFALDTPILMYDGTIKKVQNISIGDVIMGDDSKPRNVLSLGSGEDEMYEISPVQNIDSHVQNINSPVHNIDSYVVNSEHILCLKMVGLNSIKQKNNKFNVQYFNKRELKYNYTIFDTFDNALQHYNILLSNEDDILEITVKDYLKLPKYIQEKLKEYKVGINFNKTDVQFDPYIIGVWLGDSTFVESQITTKDSRILTYLRTKLHKYNLNLHHLDNYDYKIVSDTNHPTTETDNQFLNVLRYYNLLNNKHIPSNYLINDKETRLKLLAGLIDINGQYNETMKSYELTQKSKQLTDNIIFLARSLGFATHQSYITKTLVMDDYYRIQIYGVGLSTIPTLCFKNNPNQNNNIQVVNNIQVISKGKGNYYGFTIDGNNRFLLGNFTVTHNTTLIKEGIAKAMDRPFAFISLGGVSDSSFLEGHSYTYEGSIYGRIVNALITTKCMNPIIYFDELDKISQTPKGDEITNLLIHLTDPAQNSHFRDKYFHGIDLDLSKATMIFSFNNPSLVNKVLMDRITTVETKYLLVNQKVNICNNYLLSEILKDVGLKNKDIIFNDNIIKFIIEKYTNEGGVRKIKSLLYNIIREINIANLTKNKIDNKNIIFPYHVTEKNIKSILKNKYEYEYYKINKEPKIGIVNGLYATSHGEGGVLPIETVWIPTNNPLEIKATGHLEKVIKESTQVACSLAWNLLSIEEQNELLKQWKDSPKGFHLHCPDGSTPKDGPSAGAALTLALYSMFTNKKIKHDVALTGEINLQGNITEIGGLEEKLEGAKRSGVKLVLYPKENQKDIEKIIKRNTELFQNDFTIIPVETIHDVIHNAIV